MDKNTSNNLKTSHAIIARLSLISHDVQTMKPAQDFINDIGYFTVPLFSEKEGRKMSIPYVITSEREIFPCTPEQLHDRGLYTEKMPFPTSRWSQKRVLEHLAGAPAPTLHECHEYVLLKVRGYLDFGGKKGIDELLSLWILGTYCFRLFPSFPYLHLNGDAGCGKTKTLTLLSLLTFNGKLMSSASTSASLLRMIDNNCSTCCLDEVESLSRSKDDDSRTVLALLNTGYKRGGGSEKCEPDPQQKGSWRNVFFDGYSPKALAGIRALDPALASRCLQILMLRSRNAEMKNRDPDDRDSDWADIRSMIYPAMLESFEKIETKMKELSHAQLTGRDWELWRPILAVAAVVDKTGELGRRMEDLALSIQRSRREVNQTVTPVLLEALEQLMEDDGALESLYTVNELADRLSAYDEEAFGWLADPQHRSRRGKWIGEELRKAGIVNGAAKTHSILGKKCKAYRLKRPDISLRLAAYGQTLADQLEGEQE
jgi:hypothetical protein